MKFLTLVKLKKNLKISYKKFIKKNTKLLNVNMKLLINCYYNQNKIKVYF